MATQPIGEGGGPRPLVFDADAHVIEPTDLYFGELLDPAYHDRVTVDTELGDHHGRLFPLLDGRPTFGGSAWMRGYLASGDGRQVLIDRFGDIAERGFDPPAMLDAFDRQRIMCAALFPSFSLHVPYTDHAAPDLAGALARAYNLWITSFAAEGGGRLFAVALIPLHDPGWAEAEIRRVANDASVRGVMIRPNPVHGRPLHHPAHDRVFSALEDVDLPMLLHEGRGGRHPFAGDRFDTWYASHVVSHPFEMMLALLGLIVEGVFDRHPRLRVGVLESGTGWLPWWLHRIDEHHELFGPRERPDLQLEPSEYFARHCVISSDSDDAFTRAVVEAVGADHVAWSSDFPHLEAKWPDGVDVFVRRAGLDEEALQTVLWDTPCRLYGEDPMALAAKVGVELEEARS
ncbi:MAG TPA: amidohydrolase family protein [Acidimicrobiales bacterium]